MKAKLVFAVLCAVGAQLISCTQKATTTDEPPITTAPPATDNAGPALSYLDSVQQRLAKTPIGDFQKSWIGLSRDSSGGFYIPKPGNSKFEIQHTANGYFFSWWGPQDRDVSLIVDFTSTDDYMEFTTVPLVQPVDHVIVADKTQRYKSRYSIFDREKHILRLGEDALYYVEEKYAGDYRVVQQKNPWD